MYVQPWGISILLPLQMIFPYVLGFFLLKRHFDMFSFFQGFSYEIQNQFGVFVKILSTDNAHEYLFFQFRSFLTSQGILHETLCANIPQQNGVVERKNHHLVETTYTLILHYNVPHHFWGDALITSYYLIYYMPSFVLGNQVPYSILYPKQALYTVPLGVFGYTCYVHDLTLGKDKLSTSP